MTLIKSISGIRGTIGGFPGQNFTPVDIVQCSAAFGQWLLENSGRPKIVIGRDARVSGHMVFSIVANTLTALGIDVVDLGLATTPTVELAVTAEKAGAGIIITASHNPAQWNALKFLNASGEFISARDGARLLTLIAANNYLFAPADKLGKIHPGKNYLDFHVQKILDIPEVNINAIKAAGLRAVIDPVNSVGATAIPALLDALNVDYTLINSTMDGQFAHNPEPLEHHLTDLSMAVVNQGADLGIAVDPDVDRLALIQENGRMFGEEYTLVAATDQILRQKSGPVVSNVSSSMALRDLAEKYGQLYYPAAVGEVNVVAKMKETNAVIGGEGNGGVIYPELHYGRDAMVGLALILSLLAEQNMSLSNLRKTYRHYEMIKDKITLDQGVDFGQIIRVLKKHYSPDLINEMDGLKIVWPQAWVQVRASNTEPILRVYAEASTAVEAKKLVDEIKTLIMTSV